MLMSKIIIAVAIVCICTWLGISKAKDYESRERILNEAINMFQGIENEITYTLTPISNAIESVRLNMYTALKEVMGIVSYELLKYNASNAVITEEIDSLTTLTAYDRQTIATGIISLGRTDLDGQKKIIAMTCATLKTQLEQAIENKKKNSKLYKTVGLATGLMIAIVFI